MLVGNFRDGGRNGLCVGGGLLQTNTHARRSLVIGARIRARVGLHVCLTSFDCFGSPFPASGVCCCLLLLFVVVLSPGH